VASSRDHHEHTTGVASPTLDALTILLASAQKLTDTLTTDPTLGRVLRALSRLPPDDREILAGALERGTAMHTVNDSLAPMSGVRLRMHPNPRLFLRVVDTREPSAPLALDAGDILPEVLRIMRRVRLVLAPEAKAVWQPVVREAVEMLSPKDVEACVALLNDVMALLTPGLANRGDPSKP
jgi:hypothetical protein